jgi:hypothetical protein
MASGEEDEDKANKFSSKTSLRAHTNTKLMVGLSDVADCKELRDRYEIDFALLKMDRDLVNKRRNKKRREMTRKSQPYRKFALEAASQEDKLGNRKSIDGPLDSDDPQRSEEFNRFNLSVVFGDLSVEGKKTV